MGQCSLQVPKAVDSPCDDFDAGTKNDQCDGSGVCIGTADSSSSSSPVAAVAGGVAAVVLSICVVAVVIRRRRRLAQSPRVEATVVNRGFDAPAEFAVGRKAGPDNLAAPADYEELDQALSQVSLPCSNGVYEAPDPNQSALYELQRSAIELEGAGEYDTVIPERTEGHTGYAPVAAYAQAVGTGGGWGFVHIEEQQSNYAAPALYAAANGGGGGNYSDEATYAAMDGAAMDGDASIDV